MKIKGKIPLLIIGALAWIVIISSCANIGMPEGGPRDSIPPVLLGTTPEYKELNYKGKDVRLTFSEYLLTDEISETLVISPPLEKRPLIKTKSKTLIVQFNEELKDSVTYSLDFKNSIVDNNEKNPLKNLRFSFSTGDVFDSLRVAGRVINADNLEPIEKGLVVLHSNLHDSAVFRVKPDYIGKTDELGLFMIDNIAEGAYNIFAINDLNGDLLYNEGAEEIAFLDSLVVPSVEFHEELDTLVKGVDSMLIMGHSHFHPDPMYLRYFMEDIFEQYLEDAKREARNKCLFLFNESVSDTFNVDLLDIEAENWNLFEYNEKADSLVMWITDTLVSNYDSLWMEISYNQLDTLDQLYLHKDTLLMKYETPKVTAKKRRRKKDEEEEGPEPIPQFTWKSNLSSTMELNGFISITAPEPIASFDHSMVHLSFMEDTVETQAEFTLKEDTSAYRTYIISHEWQPEYDYTLRIDSAACENVYGITSSALNKKFKTREEDYYCTLSFSFSNVEMPMVVQLLENSDNEKVLQQKQFFEDGELDFDYLAPDKYMVKVIYDANGNGKWDAGSYQDRVQAERVAYVQEVVNMRRSNWSTSYQWDLTPIESFPKNVIDEELEAKKRKEAAEKAKQEREAERKSSPFQPGNSSTGTSGFQRQQ